MQLTAGWTNRHELLKHKQKDGRNLSASSEVGVRTLHLKCAWLPIAPPSRRTNMRRSGSREHTLFCCRNLDPAIGSELCKPFAPHKIVRRAQASSHPVEGGELVGVGAEKCFQFVLEGFCRRIGVNADRPKSRWFLNRLPKLLRNPENAVTSEGPDGKAIREHAETFLGQGTESAAVETVAGSHKQARIKAVATKDFESAMNPRALLRFVDAGKLGFVMKMNQRVAPAVAEVLVAMQGDGSPGVLARAHSIPKVVIGRLQV